MVTMYARRSKAQPTPFVKRIEEILEPKLPPSSTRHKYLTLANQGLVGKFTGIWPSPKIVATWVQKYWKPYIKGQLHQFFCGRGFYAFLFESKEDMDLIFYNRPYFWVQWECTKNMNTLSFKVYT